MIVKSAVSIMHASDASALRTRGGKGLAALLMVAGVLGLACSSSGTSGAGGSGGNAQGGGSVAAGGSSATGGSGSRPTGGTRATGGAAEVGGSVVNPTGGTGGSGGRGGAGGGAGTAAGGSAGGSGTGGRSGIGTGGIPGASGGTNGGGGGVGGTGGASSKGGAAGSSGRDGSVGGADGSDANRPGDATPDERAADAASFPGTNNPVLPGVNADPHVVIFDDTFYIYPTTDGFDSWGSTSFSVFSSTNLVKWTNRGVILDLPTGLSWAKSRGWAPSTVRVGDTYYFYFSADAQLGVATSSSPTGPFKDALDKPLATTRQYGPQSIDPYAFIDDDGTPYLYFGSGSGGLLVAKLNRDMISFSGAPTNISPSGASGTLEGSAMLKRNGTYYLLWSEGDTRNATYKMAYARAQAPLGPFTRLATILQQDTGQGILGPGGGTVLGIPGRDEYYVVYHRFKIPGGDGTHRETCIDRLSFASDGTIATVKPTLAGLQIGVTP